MLYWYVIFFLYVIGFVFMLYFIFLDSSKTEFIVEDFVPFFTHDAISETNVSVAGHVSYLGSPMKYCGVSTTKALPPSRFKDLRSKLTLTRTCNILSNLQEIIEEIIFLKLTRAYVDHVTPNSFFCN